MILGSRAPGAIVNCEQRRTCRRLWDRTQRTGRRPAEEAHETGPAQVDAAVEYRRLGRPADDALQLPAAAARQAEAQLLDLELVLGAGE